jgi:molybdate transport system regulatory protein
VFRYPVTYTAKNGPVQRQFKENIIKTSARNAFEGKITALTDGKVNAEVAVTTQEGDRIVAIVTEGSVQSLGLAVGKPAIAYVKAPWVMVLVHAVITNEAVLELGLKPGKPACALIKAGHVVLGVPV